MAVFYSSSWSSVPNGGAKYRLALVCNVASQNVAANTTTVNWSLIIQKDRSWRGFYDYNGLTSVQIDGVTVYNWDSFPTTEWPGWSEWTLASGSRTITHDSDGKKSLVVGGSWQRSALGWNPGTMDVSGRMDLPTIARATQPKVSPSPATVGSTVKIDLPRAVSGFTHDVTWEAGSLSGTIGTGLGTSVNWVVPSVMGEFPGQKNGAITITAVTKNGGTTIGTRQVTLLAKNPPPAPGIKTFKPDQEFDVRARVVKWNAVTEEWRSVGILPTISLSMVDPSSATATCTLKMSKRQAVDFEDYSIVDIEVFDGEGWVFTNHRFVLSRVEGDDVDPSEVYTYSGTEFVDYMLGFAYVPDDYHWDGGTNHAKPTSPGEMMRHAISKAKARGWGPRIDFKFDAAKTSLGDAWSNKAVSRNVSKGTPLSQMLEGLVNDGYAEYQVEYHSNKAWLVLLNPGTGSAYTDVGASPVVNLATANLSRAPRRGTSEKRLTRVTVIGDTSTDYGNKGTKADNVTTTVRATRERAPFDEEVFGHMEGWVSASGVTNATEAGKIGENALRDNASTVDERTFEYNAQDAAPQFYPYLVFQPGDWILVPGTDGPVSDRISQITITKEPDGKSFTILTGDRILSGTASLAKRQSAQTGGAIAGGNGTSPTSLDARIPNAPVIDTVVSAGYWTNDGTARSEITVTWTEVVEALSGSDIAVDLYEVWWRETVGGVWKFRAATADTEIDMPDWDVQKDYSLRVRARSVDGVFGEFSEDQEHTTLAPVVDLDGPNLSDLYTDGLGSIYAIWDGTLDGVPAPNRLGYVAAEVSSDGGTVWAQMGTPIAAAGSIIINPGAYGSFHVRLRAFDGLGNPGDVSAPQAITLTDPHLNEIVSLSSTTQALVVPSTGGPATVPATAVVTGTGTNTTITTWQYSVDGAPFTNTPPVGAVRSGNSVTITGATMTARTIAVRMADAHGKFDVITVAKLTDGADGADGGDGAPGAPGTGISSTEVRYQVGTSGTSAPTGSWLTAPPTTTAGQYLWTRTVTNYTDSTDTTAYSVARHGATGAAGRGITGTVVNYAVGTSGTSAPSSGWGASIPAVTAGQFLWTRTVTSYTSGDPTTAYAVGKMGDTGAAGVGISGTEVRYQVGTSGTTAPTGSWLTAPPATTAGQYLWTRTVTSYTAGADTTAYSVARHGATGAAGVGISGTEVRYQIGTSGVTAPTGTWLASVPATVAGQFLWTRTVTSYTAGAATTAYSVAAHGQTGATGATGNGVTGSTVRYQIGTSGTTAPTSTWLTTIPSTVTGQFLWTRTVTSYTTGSDTTAYSVAAHGQTGATGATGNGVTGSTVMYQASSSGTAIPTGTWVASPPATTSGQYLWTRTITTYNSTPNTTSYAVSRHGEAAYTVLMTNESHTFAGTASSAVLGSTTSRVIAYKGATAMNATVGTITGQVTGLTTSITANGTAAPIITINVTEALVELSGTLNVPITVDGTTFAKTFSWSVARSVVGAKVPLPPTGLTVTPGAGWDASGFFPQAWFDVYWTPPTLDTEGAPVDVAGYDVWGKRTNESESRLLTSTSVPNVRHMVADDEEWSFQVAAISSTGGVSILTDVVTRTADAVASVAPAPAAPTLEQHIGLLRIKWSGVGMLPQIKYAYATISTSAGGTYTRAGMPLTGAGEVVIPGLAPAQYWAKIVIVDERGKMSTSPAAGPITLLPITGVTIQTSQVANTGIKLTDAALTAYDVSGNPSFILDAATGAVWIAPYDAVFEFGASGIVAETGVATTGVQISSENSSFNTFFHPAGVQIRNDATPLSWWEADASDASLVNFVSPRARIDDRFKLGDYEFLREAKTNGSRLVIRYQGE